jgi:hypothetical protein
VEKIAVYREKNMKHKNKPCGQNAEWYYVKAGGIYSNHWALNGQIDSSIYSQSTQTLTLQREINSKH